MDLKQIWQTTLAEIELQISRPNFLTWFKNSRLIEKRDDGVVLIGLSNNFTKEWVENKYNKLILGILRSLDSSIKKIEYLVITEKQLIFNVQQDDEPQLSFPELKIDFETGLHPRYKLKSFVVGSSNELAYAATTAVVKHVGKKYNPLFIYGGVGLGKTHLIQAAGNEIKNFYKNKIKIKYVTSEKFVNDVVGAIRNKRMEDVKNKYRNIDVLIIDDIQFIGGKEASEMEFFHTFNVLHENNKQIIISSDRPPAAIPTLEERLRSRFEGGMIADITCPDFEMRVAIIKNKLNERGVDLSDEICHLIATKIQRNIREIEGVLNRMLFYKEVKNVDFTIKTTEEIINEVAQQLVKKISANTIVKSVADFFELSQDDLIDRSRRKEIIGPRQIAAFLLRDLLGMSYPDIGERLGKRDHTTAIHSCGKISKEINTNRSLNNKIILIKELIYKNS